MGTIDKNDMGLVSVIIPVYNSEMYIEKCIKSVCEQVYSNLEIIIVNDGSTDGSLGKCMKMASFDQRIVIINKENGGVSSARNVGLERAQGKYISFIDSDDWIEKELYSDMLKSMQESECECGMFEYYIDYPGSTIQHKHQGEASVLKGEDALFATISPVNRFACTKIFERSLVEDIRFDESIFVGEDTLFSCCALKKANRVYFSDVPLYHYFQNNKSATGMGYNENFMTVIEAYKQICGLVADNRRLEICARSELAIFLVNNIVGIYNNYKDLHFDEAKKYLHMLRCYKKELLRHKQISIKYKIKIMFCSCSPLIYSYLVKNRRRF